MAGISGVSMMMKSFGLDPEMLTKGAEEFKQIAVNAELRLSAIEATNKRIEEKVDLLLKNPVLNNVKLFSDESILEIAGVIEKPTLLLEEQNVGRNNFGSGSH